ncbi:MAG TPA: DUF2892 domain-containing protein [Polyangia bacterium]|nr:DUF2892 domain-containing protein [Polyangia bacterium]
MLWNHSKRNRILLIACGLVILAMSVVGPKSLWCLLGILPLFAGAVGDEPLFTISGRDRWIRRGGGFRAGT